jgi:hypothetical protein
MIKIAPIIRSLVAIAFSIFAFLEGRRRHKRDLFLKIHELLISEDQYRGRQLLLSREFNDESIESLSPGERANISRALATYDTLGLYLERRYLIESDVMSMWGDPAHRAWQAAGQFVARRERKSGLPAYPHFGALAERARSTHQRSNPGESPGGDRSAR